MAAPKTEIVPYIPRKELRREHGGARGWIKPRWMTGLAHDRVKLTFKKGPGSPPVEFLSFYIDECQLARFRTDHPVFTGAPAGSFVFDARHLIEYEGATYWRAQRNLKALDDAYAWWKENKLGSQVTFFCYSGHNRSVTSSVFFACSTLMELLDGDDKWSVVGSIYRSEGGPRKGMWKEGAENLDRERAFLGDFEDFPNFVLALVSQIRPEAFYDTVAPLKDEMWKMATALANAGAKMARDIEIRLAEVERRMPKAIAGKDVISKADPTLKIASILDGAVEPQIKRPGKPPTPVKLLDYWTIWRGHDDNRQILRLVDAALRARMYESWWVDQTWLGKELPLVLLDARVGREGPGGKRSLPGTAELSEVGQLVTEL
jgi:hypothetical protein